MNSVLLSPVSRPERPADRRSLLLTGASLLAFFLAEFLYFDRQTSRFYAWLYPRWNDQVQYLTQAYLGHEWARQVGFFRGIMAALTTTSAQGVLTNVVTVALFQIVGPSRSAALALNMVAWIALQAAVFVLVLNWFRSLGLAWLSLGLLLLWQTPFFGGPGSAWDFRLDFISACLFGIVLTLAIATQGFATAGRSAWFGVGVAAMLVERFMSGTYFAVIFLGFGLWLLAIGRPRRLLNLGLSAGVAAVLAGPIFWINRQTVWVYYYLGHFVGPERAARESGMGFFASVGWIFREVFWTHLSGWFAFTVVGITAVLGIQAFCRRRNESRSVGAPDQNWLFPLLLFLLAPVLVLSLHAEKSFVVLSVLVPPLFVLVVYVWARLAIRGPVLLFAALICVGTGAVHFAVSQSRPNYDDSYREDARAVSRFAVRIAELSRKAGLVEPMIAVDQVTDSMEGRGLSVIEYERERTWMVFGVTLPLSIVAQPQAVVMQELALSDFVVLHSDGSDGTYPFDREMNRLLPVTRLWCDQHLTRLDEFSLFGRRWTLYARPKIARGQKS